MKELLSKAPSFYKIRIYFLSALVLASSIWLVSTAFSAFGDSQFFLLHEDEVIYYCSAKLFAATNSVQAESCIWEMVSPIGSMNWYGPGYHIVYGTLFKVFGNHPAVFPWFHLFLAAASIALIFLCPIPLESRLLAALSFLLTPQFSAYIFTYFPESLNLFLATFLTYMLTLLFTANDPRRRMIVTIAFVVAVAACMLCRITFIFWLPALVALADTRRHRIIACIIAIVGIGVSVVYMKYFIAPPYASTMQKLESLYTLEIGGFLKATYNAFISNLKAFVWSNLPLVKLMAWITAISLVSVLVLRTKFSIAVMLVVVCIFSVMMSYYLVDDFYFIKQTAMLLPLFFVSAALGRTKLFSYTAVVVVVLFFGLSRSKINTAIENGRSAYDLYDKNQSFRDALNEIPSHVKNENLVILWDYREYDYGYSTEALLPFATIKKKPILYTTNIVEPNASEDARFQRHGRLKLDYILSRKPLTFADVKLVHKTEFYHLYEIVY